MADPRVRYLELEILRRKKLKEDWMDAGLWHCRRTFIDVRIGEGRMLKVDDCTMAGSNGRVEIDMWGVEN